MTAAVNAAGDLATLYPAPKTITIAGRSIQIGEPTLRQVAVYEQHMIALAALGSDPNADDAVLMEENPAITDAALLAVMPALDPVWLASLHVLRKSELLSEWMEFNGPFLEDRTKQRQRLTRAAAVMFGAGPMSSFVSPAPTSTTPATSPSAPPSSYSPPLNVTTDAAAIPA